VHRLVIVTAHFSQGFLSFIQRYYDHPNGVGEVIEDKIRAYTNDRTDVQLGGDMSKNHAELTKKAVSSVKNRARE
jgi:hypothetical protein